MQPISITIFLSKTMSKSIPFLIMTGAIVCFLGTAVSAQGRDAPLSAGPGPNTSRTLPDSNRSSAHFAWADVLRVDPIYDTVSVTRPRRECHDVQVVERQRGNGGAGAVLGAVVGGVLGNTIGKGDGRKAATVAGAVAGGAIGHGTATRNDGDTSYTRTRCEDVPEVTHERRISSYDVEYRYHGDVYVSRLPYDPGERLRVRVNVTPAD